MHLIIICWLHGCRSVTHRIAPTHHDQIIRIPMKRPVNNTLTASSHYYWCHVCRVVGRSSMAAVLSRNNNNNTKTSPLDKFHQLWLSLLHDNYMIDDVKKRRRNGRYYRGDFRSAALLHVPFVNNIPSTTSTDMDIMMVIFETTEFAKYQ